MQESGTSQKKNSGATMVFASLGGLYLLVCLCLGLFVYVSRQQIPVVQDYFPTQTALPTATLLPTATSVPHIPGPGDVVIKSDFSNNTQGWASEWKSGKLTVADGHLSFETTGNTTGRIKCTPCKFAHDNFYIEADFSTDKTTKEGFGITFNISNAYSVNDESYYLFEINLAKERYALYKFKNYAGKSDWLLRLSKKSDLVKPYPQTNKLGVAFNKDTMALYLNGILVDTYQDPGTVLTSGEFGFFIDGSGFQLNIDNFFSYGK